MNVNADSTLVDNCFSLWNLKYPETISYCLEILYYTIKEVIRVTFVELCSLFGFKKDLKKIKP